MNGNCARAARVAACALVLGWWVAGCGGAPVPRLLLLATVDTLRADELGAYGSERGLTPHIDALAGESIVFEAAYAAAPLTLPSLAALFTGRYPEELGMRTNESAVPGSVATLATELSAHGWRTGAVVGNFVLRKTSGLARGFDLFDDEFPQREAVRRWPERTAAHTTDAAIAMLEECTSPPDARCFLWVHYQDPHGPYEPPRGRREALMDSERRAADGTRELPAGADHTGFGAIPNYQLLQGRRDIAFYRAGYRAEIAYMDEELGRLLGAVRSRGLQDRAVVVFAADHGESLGEGGVWFSHGARLTDEQTRVPLLVRIAGRRPVRRPEPVSLVDLYPTLLALLAGTPAGEGRPGRDLLADDAPNRASSPYMATLGAAPTERYGLVRDGYKFIVTERNGVFDGTLHAVGREDDDLSAAAPQVAGRMRRSLASLRAALDRAPETPQELDEADRQRLRQLGYGEPAASDE